MAFFCKIRAENIWIAIQNFKNQKNQEMFEAFLEASTWSVGFLICLLSVAGLRVDGIFVCSICGSFSPVQTGLFAQTVRNWWEPSENWWKPFTYKVCECGDSVQVDISSLSNFCKKK